MNKGRGVFKLESVDIQGPITLCMSSGRYNTTKISVKTTTGNSRTDLPDSTEKHTGWVGQGTQRYRDINLSRPRQ